MWPEFHLCRTLHKPFFHIADRKKTVWLIWIYQNILLRMCAWAPGTFSCKNPITPSELPYRDTIFHCLHLSLCVQRSMSLWIFLTGKSQSHSHSFTHVFHDIYNYLIHRMKCNDCITISSLSTFIMKMKIILLLLNYLVFLNSVYFCSTSMLIIIHLFISRNALLMKFWEFYLNLYIILLHIFSNNLIAYQDV